MLKFHASETVCPAMTENKMMKLVHTIYNIRLKKKISFVFKELITGTLYTLHILIIIMIYHFSNHDLMVLVAEIPSY